ncbi:uncharacterized protein MONBRDRAFT_19578 [Monosiga brevicollis MX1]|uniref:Uncharacterized protein n=1 Tax=Monosiga brevicollis TaxID=81824 RepID=A9US88_MONBE|nr:uncharacterized protein MONBRDRAFT_19578 [Monosiga brevicollis MX1]EDQ92058.1 predicted protein [Monosiga brevicollis MX1]|eukprot:XP_001743344.1 hypothetical protein [Monosiga brevicollis MX1]
MTWFDQQNSGSLAVIISQDVPKIQEAMGDKFGSFIQFEGMFLGGFIVGFIYSWKLALVVFSMVPLIGAGGAVMSKYIGDAQGGGNKFYGRAGAIADEVIRMIRTVIAFDTQDHECERYEKSLEDAERSGRTAGLAQGGGMGFTFGVIFLAYALTFYYGGQLINDGELSAGDVITCFFSVIIGAMALGQAAPNIATMAAGQAAAYKVFDIIERQSAIDSLSDEGIVPTTLEGAIEFKDIEFTYPTRPEEQILRGLNLSIKPRETIALVGSSGCGKSTTMALVERFYDPSSGSVSLDGINIKDINVQWLRSQIALVSQMPVLFPTSIFDNIALGGENVTEEQVIAAAKMANAHDFISRFPDGYDTMVGDSGAQMSGGQRQRIVIARALVKNPNILLLDEATSALDNESEGKVKEALDRASMDRTTIVIAHRLSTVFTADRIAVVHQGKVVEIGDPQSLLDKKGRFYDMVFDQYGQGMERGTTLTLDALQAAIPTDNSFKGAAGDEDDLPVRKTSRGEIALAADLKEDPDKDDKGPDVDRSMVGWVLQLNRPEWKYIAIGAFGAFIEGAVWPAYAICLSEVITAMQNSDLGTINDYAAGFVGIAVAVMVCVFLKFYMLTRSGEALTRRLRSKTFRAIVSNEAWWYDMPENARGILTARLSSDASAVRGVLGDRVGLAMQIFATVVGCLIVSMIYCWRVALVVLAASPIIGVGGALQFKLMSGFADTKAYERSGKFASQAIEHVRDVAALGRLNAFVEDYFRTLAGPTKATKRQAQVQGLTFGFTEASIFAVWALTFWWGAQVTNGNHCTFNEMFKSQFAILFMGIIVGQASSLAPDFGKAMVGAKRLYTLLKDHEERHPKEEARPSAKITGQIEFKDIKFNYPTRPDARVLDGFSLSVIPGQTVALVGPSGCGKSTVIALTEQFYRPDSGTITLDGKNIQDIDPKCVREHFALVAQQPELFALTIAENIAYGLDHTPSQEDIERAAKAANAHDFITDFEDGYNTMVGDKGAQLSGGQRQRIAIARALIRQDNIKILLLDEASAALDTHSEQLVHEALEGARKGRTTLVVAHRLSTIQNADLIAVLNQGKVAELGSHEELMKQGGLYAELVNSQQFVSTDENENGGNSNPPGMLLCCTSTQGRTPTF